jgi:hypothetical protein
VIGSSQGLLRDNTQRSPNTHMHAPGWIRTRNPSKRVALDPRPRSRKIILKGDDSTLIKFCLIASLFKWAPMLLAEIRGF